MTRKKIHFLSLVLTLLSVAFVNQSCTTEKQNAEKLFNEAILKGPDDNYCYSIKNTNKKSVEGATMRKYVEDKGYQVLGISVIVGRFSSKVDKLTFFDPKNLKEVAYKLVSFRSPSDFTAKGTCFLIVDKHRHNLEELRHLDRVLKRYDNVLWTGEVKDGLLNGTGTGIIKFSETNYMSIIGGFDHGVPSQVIWVGRLNIEPRNSSLSSSEEMFIGHEPAIADREVCARHLDSKDPVLIKAILYRLKSYYNEDAIIIEDIYADAKTVNMSNYSKFELKNENIDRVKLFINVCEKNNYDPKNDLPKAREVLDVYKIVFGLNKEIETYYGFNGRTIFTQNYSWFDDKVKYDRNVFSECLEASRRMKDGSNYGFNNLGSGAYPILKKKYADFEKKVESDYNEYSRKHDKLAKEHQTSEQKLSHEINWDNAKEPSGKLINMGPLSSYKTYEKNGRIYTKSGRDYCEYNIIYKPNKEVDCYRIYYSTKQMNKKDFKSYGELVEAFLNAIK